MGKTGAGKVASRVGRREQPGLVGETDVARAEAAAPVVRSADVDSQPDDGGSHGGESQPDTHRTAKSDTD